jgi:hypothetical protein
MRRRPRPKMGCGAKERIIWGCCSEASLLVACMFSPQYINIVSTEQEMSCSIQFLSFLMAYEGVTKSFRTGRLERELQMVELSATKCKCIAILWVSLVSFVVIILCIASQRMFNVVRVYFFIDSVRKLLDTPSYSKEVSKAMATRRLPVSDYSEQKNCVWRRFVMFLHQIWLEW